MSYLDIYNRLRPRVVSGHQQLTFRRAPHITMIASGPQIYDAPPFTIEPISMYIKWRIGNGMEHSWVIATYNPDYIQISLPPAIQTRPRFWIHKANEALRYAGVPLVSNRVLSNWGATTNKWFYMAGGKIYYQLPNTTDALRRGFLHNSCYRVAVALPYCSPSTEAHNGEVAYNTPCTLSIFYDGSCNYPSMNKIITPSSQDQTIIDGSTRASHVIGTLANQLQRIINWS